MLIKLGRRSPRWLAALWFASFRLLWAIYWFGFQRQDPQFVFSFVFGGLPIILSTLAAGVIGYAFGHTILDPSRTRSYFIASIRGALVNLLTTILYLPIGTLIISLSQGHPEHFFAGLYFSAIFSLAGVPIHIVIGTIAGITLYRTVTLKISSQN